MNGILRKVKSSHNKLRSDEIRGIFIDPPKIGQVFRFFSTPLTKQADIRVITTTKVLTISEEGSNIKFETKQSEYELEINE